MITKKNFPEESSLSQLTYFQRVQIQNGITGQSIVVDLFRKKTRWIFNYNEQKHHHSSIKPAMYLLTFPFKCVHPFHDSTTALGNRQTFSKQDLYNKSKRRNYRQNLFSVDIKCNCNVP